MRRHAVGLALALASASCEFAAAGAFSAPLPLRHGAGSANVQLRATSAPQHQYAATAPAERLRGGGDGGEAHGARAGPSAYEFAAMMTKLTELGQGHLLEGLTDDREVMQLLGVDSILLAAVCRSRMWLHACTACTQERSAHLTQC